MRCGPAERQTTCVAAGGVPQSLRLTLNLDVAENPRAKTLGSFLLNENTSGAEAAGEERGAGGSRGGLLARIRDLEGRRPNEVSVPPLETPTITSLTK